MKSSFTKFAASIKSQTCRQIHSHAALRIFLQLVREFWGPFFISLVWTAYNYGMNPAGWISSAFVNSAFVTFFAISFFFSQWNRVKKQLRVDEGLTGIEHKVEEMLDRLDKKTHELLGHITGGDNYCAIVGAPGIPTICNFGDNTLFEVTAQFVDLDLMAQNSGKVDPQQMYHGYEVHLGTLHSKTAVMWPRPAAFQFGSDDVARYININFSARNGRFYQHLRFKNVGGQWAVASRVLRTNPKVILQEVVSPQYPRNANGDVDWDYPS